MLGMDVKYYKALRACQPGVEVPDESSETDPVVRQPLTDPAMSALSPFARAAQNPLPESSA
eukprot:11980022-Heterocapsa_arctica.AAC.1